MAIFTFDQALKKQGVTAKDVTSVGVIEPKTNNQSFLQETGSDIKQIGTDISSSFKTRQASVQASKEAQAKGSQSGLQTLYQTAGQSAGLISDIFGSIIKGGVKAVLPQSAENALKSGVSKVAEPVVNSDLVKNIISKYNSLDENTKRNLDATLGLGSLALDVASLGAGKKVADVGIKTGTELALKTGEIVAPTIEKTGSLLKTAGEATTGLVTKMEDPTKIALQSYQASQPSLFGRIKNLVTGNSQEISNMTKPVTEAQTSVRLVEPGTQWQVGVNAKRTAQQLWDNTISPALRASENTNDMKTFLGNLKEKIVTTTKDLDRRKVLLKAWQSFADDYKNVRTFSDKKLQEYKEGWARFVPEKSYKGEPIGAASKEVRALAADEARQTLYKILPDGEAKQAYIDYSNLKSIAEAGIKSVEPLDAKGFTRKIYEAIIDKAVTPIATISGKILYRTGEGLEFIGSKGAKKVKDILNQ